MSVTALSPYTSSPEQVLAVISRAREDLVSIEDPREAASFVRRADAIKYLAKKADASQEVQNQAVELALRAKRRAGELLAEREKPPTGPKPPGLGNSLLPNPPTLDELGVTKIDSSRWQAIASVPEERFERYIADKDQELTTAGLLSTAHVSHASGESEWYTPAPYIEAARSVMGAIDLDPASSAEANQVVGAARFYTAEDDGLTQPWAGRLWLNPPYSQPLITEFCERLVESVATGAVTQACVLVNNATETAWFGRLAAAAGALCFPTGRIRFWYPDRESVSPLQGQAVVYFGSQFQAFHEIFTPFGLTWERPREVAA